MLQYVTDTLQYFPQQTLKIDTHNSPVKQFILWLFLSKIDLCLDFTVAMIYIYVLLWLRAARWIYRSIWRHKVALSIHHQTHHINSLYKIRNAANKCFNIQLAINLASTKLRFVIACVTPAWTTTKDPHFKIGWRQIWPALMRLLLIEPWEMWL